MCFFDLLVEVFFNLHVLVGCVGFVDPLGLSESASVSALIPESFSSFTGF